MSTGKVKFFNETKGFGFIVEDDTNNEYFVHISGVVDADSLEEGQEVSFELEEGKRGMNAVNVTIL
jgi:CspA family cold shock protein